MPFLDVQVTVQGDTELRRAFDLMATRVNDWRPYWPDIAAVFYRMEQGRFDSGGYGSWRQLSDGYRKWKMKNYPGENILQLTGNLRRSLTSQFNPNAVFESQERELVLGTTVPYAELHQYGTGRMPARPPIDIREQDINEMARVAVEHFDRYADQLGFETHEE